MGEYADSMLDGSACDECGTYLGEAVGHHRLCADCSGNDPQEESKRRRAANRENSNRILREHGYTFEERNDGAHLIVATAVGVIDFWPGTGKFIVRQTRHEARGVGNLMKHGAPVTRPLESNEIQWAPHMSQFTINTYTAAGYTVVGELEQTK